MKSIIEIWRDLASEGATLTSSACERPRGHEHKKGMMIFYSGDPWHLTLFRPFGKLHVAGFFGSNGPQVRVAVFHCFVTGIFETSLPQSLSTLYREKIIIQRIKRSETSTIGLALRPNNGVIKLCLGYCWVSIYPAVCTAWTFIHFDEPESPEVGLDQTRSTFKLCWY